MANTRTIILNKMGDFLGGFMIIVSCKTREIAMLFTERKEGGGEEACQINLRRNLGKKTENA